MPIVHIEITSGADWKYHFDDLLNAYAFVKAVIDDYPIQHYEWLTENKLVFQFTNEENKISVHLNDEHLPKVETDQTPLWLDQLALPLGGKSLWIPNQD